MNLKKLLAIAALALSTFMSIGVASAQADVAYTFNFYSSGAFTGPAADTYQYQVQLLANPTDGTVDQFTYLGAGPKGNLTNYTSAIYDFPGITGGYVNSATDYKFQVDYIGPRYGLYATSAGLDYGTGVMYGGQVSGFASTNGVGGVGDILAPLAVGAPEIDGSLAPKVGFLLGCLFLMFGRKKQNTEALMTA